MCLIFYYKNIMCNVYRNDYDTKKHSIQNKLKIITKVSDELSHSHKSKHEQKLTSNVNVLSIF